MDFSNIFLSKEQFELLKKLARSKVKISPETKTAFKQLEQLEFAETDFVASSENTSSGGNNMTITDLGKNYLNYTEARLRRIQKNDRRYWFTTVIAILALIVSIVALIRR